MSSFSELLTGGPPPGRLAALMYSFLKEQNARPPLFSAYTVEELWTDPHVAQQMLALHLDPDHELASRKHDFIERSIGWLGRSFDLDLGR